MADLSDERRTRYELKLDKIRVRQRNIADWTAGMDAAAFQADTKTRLSVYKAFQEATEAVSDIAAMYLVDTGRPVTDDYENLERASGTLYSADLQPALAEANGLRNRLVHEYDKLDAERALEAIERLHTAIETFRTEVGEWIETQ